MKLSIQESTCEICGEKPEEINHCNTCGATFCRKCGNENRCLVCIESICYICGEYLASRACNDCGKLVCEDHSMKDREATYCERCQLS